MKRSELITVVRRLLYANQMKPVFTVHINFLFLLNSVGPVTLSTERCLEKLGEGNSALVDPDVTT